MGLHSEPKQKIQNVGCDKHRCWVTVDKQPGTSREHVRIPHRNFCFIFYWNLFIVPLIILCITHAFLLVWQRNLSCAKDQQGSLQASALFSPHTGPTCSMLCTSSSSPEMAWIVSRFIAIMIILSVLIDMRCWCRRHGCWVQGTSLPSGSSFCRHHSSGRVAVDDCSKYLHAAERISKTGPEMKI